MNRIVILSSVLLAVCAVGQVPPIPPAPALRYHAANVPKQSAQLKVHAKVVVQPPATVTISAPGALIQQSVDMVHWTVIGTNSVTEPATGTAFHRAQSRITLLWTPVDSPVVAGYRLYQWVDPNEPVWNAFKARTADSAQGVAWNVYDVGNTNSTTVPLLPGDLNSFAATTVDIYGAESQFSTHVSVEPTQPTITIK